MPAQRHSQPTPASLGHGCKPLSHTEIERNFGEPVSWAIFDVPSYSDGKELE